MSYKITKDYAGNEIVPGMIIYYVTTEISHAEMGILIPGEGYRKVREASIEKGWFLSRPYEVYIGRNGRLWTKTDETDGESTYTFHAPIEGIFPMPEPPMIAIKGISDQEPKGIIIYGE